MLVVAAHIRGLIPCGKMFVIRYIGAIAMVYSLFVPSCLYPSKLLGTVLVVQAVLHCAPRRQ